MYPATSSESASVRSNGGRLSSAVAAMAKIANGTTASWITFQFGRTAPIPRVACCATMSCVDSDPETSTTEAIESPRAAS